MADFTQHDLGHQKRGSVVVVTLKGHAANVQLLDGTGLSNYRNGRQYSYRGGLVKSSPYRLVIPRDGRWYVTVDLNGLGGSVRSAVHVVPPPRGPLPLARQPTPAASPPLARIAGNIEAVAPESPGLGKAHDVFICHASEDKDAVVRDLALALQGRGLDVWYDEFTLRIGDNLRRKIDGGLTSSRFGVAVLSPAFFEKEFPQYELDGLVTREMAGEQQIILPIWHKLTREELAARSPSLANKVALRTEDLTIDAIADQIADVIAGGEA